MFGFIKKLRNSQCQTAGNNATQIQMSGNSSVTINGKTFTGNNISIINDKVYIDGIEQTEDTLKRAPVFHIHINGNVDKVISASADINIEGSVNSASTVSGDISISGDATSVETVSGDITANRIGTAGSVSGDITI